jgi:hypothetical protein
MMNHGVAAVTPVDLLCALFCAGGVSFANKNVSGLQKYLKISK